MQEIWKDIPDFEGYMISNFGRVYSNKKNRLMSISKNDKGYCYAHIYKNSKQHHLKLHRLVAKLFIPNPNSYNEVNHIDGDKNNNKADNLEWCDHTYNMREAFKNGLIPPRKVNSGSFKKGHIPWNKGKKLK